jgi:hypothetical protein
LDFFDEEDEDEDEDFLSFLEEWRSSLEADSTILEG